MDFFGGIVKLAVDHVGPVMQGTAAVVGESFQGTAAAVGESSDGIAAAAGPVIQGTAAAAGEFFAHVGLDKMVQDLLRDIERAVAHIDGRVFAIGLAVAAGVLSVGAAIPMVLYFGLPGLGFTAAGVAAGSVAATWQSILGDVAAGSLFAILQSAAAGGYGVPLVAGAVGAVGVGAGVGVGVAGSIAADEIE